jgi:hypothetical protein
MNRARWAYASARIAAGVAAAVLPFFAPPLREALVALEPLVAPALFLAALVLAALAVARPSRKRRRAELLVLRWLGRWGWALAVLAFLAPVWAHWSLRPPGAAAAFGALFGQIPWSDMNQHYEGALRLLGEGRFGPYSERRPLNAALLSVRLALTGGDLRAATLLNAAACGLCAWMLARTVAIRRGLAASLGTFAVVLGLARDFLPTTATEPLGIAFACLALALLLLPLARRQLLWAALGLLALDTALRARPGAQLLVPALMLWVLWVFRRRWMTALAAVAAVAVVGSLSTSALNAFYGSGQATFTTYPAYTLYGLSRYSNWTQASADFGDALERMGDEKQVARFLYGQAVQNVRRSPSVFVRALRRNLTRFLGKLPGNLARTVTLGPLFRADDAAPGGDDYARDTRLGVPLLVMGGLAWLAYLWRARGEDRLFWAAAVAGLLASVPLVYGDAGFRGLAPAYPFIAVALAIGLGRPGWPEPGARAQRPLALLASAATVAVLVIAVAGPALARGSAERPSSVLLGQAEPGSLVIVPGQSTAVVVSGLRRAPFARVPRIERREFLRMLDWAALEPPQRAPLEQARTPFAVVSAYDYAGRRQALLLAPPEVLRDGSAVLSVQAVREGTAAFATVTGWRRLDQPGAQRQEAAPAAEPES